MSFELIGLTGPARSGKDTVAGILETHGFKRLSYAAPIKEMLVPLIGNIPDEDKEKIIPWLGVSPRYLMQTLGTEWGRMLVKPTIWRDILSHRIDLAMEEGHSKFVISDVRFQNEYDWVRAIGGAVWRIQRPDCDPVLSHSSEQLEEPGDYIIENDWDVDALRARVAEILRIRRSM